MVCVYEKINPYYTLINFWNTIQHFQCRSSTRKHRKAFNNAYNPNVSLSRDYFYIKSLVWYSRFMTVWRHGTVYINKARDSGSSGIVYPTPGHRFNLTSTYILTGTLFFKKTILINKSEVRIIIGPMWNFPKRTKYKIFYKRTMCYLN